MEIQCPICKTGKIIEIHVETYQATTMQDEWGIILDPSEDDLERGDAYLDTYVCGDGCGAEWETTEHLYAALQRKAD